MLPDMKKLHIADIHAPVITLGPGRRFVVWVQGCCFDCSGCTSPQWRTSDGGVFTEVEELSQVICKTPNIQGLTISGGEPMLQAGTLAHLVQIVRRRRPLSVICYTGFDLKALENDKEPARMKLISLCDVLIDGPYIAALNDNRGASWVVQPTGTFYQRLLCRNERYFCFRPPAYATGIFR
ncbi:MAG: 4Fe-4S single cluster domain-containing protein [Deltaproteobacteria bacterium]